MQLQTRQQTTRIDPYGSSGEWVIIPTLRRTHDPEPSRNSCGKCVRGLLCGRCNMGLGNLDDDIEILLKSIDYLMKYRDKQISRV